MNSLQLDKVCVINYVSLIARFAIDIFVFTAGNTATNR